MLCPESNEGEIVQKETKQEETKRKKKLLTEGAGGLELSSFKSPKTWKNSFTKFFRNQIRSSRSNDGERPSGSNERFVEKDISPEQKWQSLGKMFRRQALVENTNKSSNQERCPQKKSLAVKKVLSSYFGKCQKSPPLPDEK